MINELVVSVKPLSSFALIGLNSYDLTPDPLTKQL